MVASSNSSSSDWFIDYGCTTRISGCRAIIIAYTEYPPNTKDAKGHNGVTSFASRYGSVRLIFQLPDGKTETIILQEVVHLPGSFNLISQSQITDKDVKVVPVHHYGLNLYNRHAKLMATALQVDGLFVLDRVLDRAPKSTKYPDIDNNSCLPPKYDDWASISTRRREADVMALWLGTRRAEGFGDLAEGRCRRSEDDWEVW